MKHKEKAFKRSPGAGSTERLNDLGGSPVLAKLPYEDRHAVVQARAEGEPLDRFSAYKLRALWIRDDRFTALRNAAYLARMARKCGGLQNPAALALMVHESEKLLNRGVGVGDLVEALCELLYHEA